MNPLLGHWGIVLMVELCLLGFWLLMVGSHASTLLLKRGIDLSWYPLLLWLWIKTVHSAEYLFLILDFPGIFTVIFNVTIPFNPPAPWAWVHWDVPFIGRSLCVASISLMSCANCILRKHLQVMLFLWTEHSKPFHLTCVLWHFHC